MTLATFTAWAASNPVLDATADIMKAAIRMELAAFKASDYPSRQAIQQWLNDKTAGPARQAWLKTQ